MTTPKYTPEELVARAVARRDKRLRTSDARPDPDLAPVDIDKALVAAHRLIDIAFRKLDANGETIRPNFRIPREVNDDDAIIIRAIKELARLRSEAAKTDEHTCGGGMMDTSQDACPACIRLRAEEKARWAREDAAKRMADAKQEEACASGATTRVEPKGPVKIAEPKRSPVARAVSLAASGTPREHASSGLGGVISEATLGNETIDAERLLRTAEATAIDDSRRALEFLADFSTVYDERGSRGYSLCTVDVEKLIRDVRADERARGRNDAQLACDPECAHCQWVRNGKPNDRGVQMSALAYKLGVAHQDIPTGIGRPDAQPFPLCGETCSVDSDPCRLPKGHLGDHEWRDAATFLMDLADEMCGAARTLGAMGRQTGRERAKP